MHSLSFSLPLLLSNLKAAPSIPQLPLFQSSHSFWLLRTSYRYSLAATELVVLSFLYVPATTPATVVNYLTITLIQSSVQGLGAKM